MACRVRRQDIAGPVHRGTAAGLAAPAVAVPEAEEAQVVVAVLVVVPEAEGAQVVVPAVPVEIDKSQSRFNWHFEPTIQKFTHKICVSSSRSLSISLKSTAAADNSQFLFSLFPENPQEL
jgi:hypothetical protein